MTSMEDEKWVYWRMKAKMLVDENEQLKIQLQNTSAQRDEFHHGARENANRVGELKKENEQLKEEIEQYKAVINKEWSKYLKKHEMI